MDNRSFSPSHERAPGCDGETLQDGRANAVRRALLKLGRYHGLSECKVRELWNLAGEKAFAATAAPSGIGSDGTPFELSVALGSKPGGLRYLTELGEGAKGWKRLADSRKKLPRLLDALGLPIQPLNRLVDEFLPDPLDQFPPLRFGMWVSPVLKPGEHQLKVYINTGWMQASDVLQRVFRLLELTMRVEARERLRRLLPELTRFHRLSFVGLENTIDGPGRIKLYFRGTVLTREWMARIACQAGDTHELLTRLWRAFLADREVGPEDVVLSVSLPQGDDPVRVKVDVAAKLLSLPDHKLAERIESVVHSEALDPADYLAALNALADVTGLPAHHSMIGISTTGDRPRINVYLRPI